MADPEPPPPGGAGAATVIEAVPLTPEADAVILVVPAETPVACPPGLIVAIPDFTVAQDTFARFWELPSLNLPDAVNCWVSLTLIKAVAGAMVIDCSVTACCDEPPEPPQPPVMTIASAAAAKDPMRLLKVRCRLSRDEGTKYLPEHTRTDKALRRSGEVDRAG